MRRYVIFLVVLSWGVSDAQGEPQSLAGVLSSLNLGGAWLRLLTGTQPPKRSAPASPLRPTLEGVSGYPALWQRPHSDPSFFTDQICNATSCCSARTSISLARRAALLDALLEGHGPASLLACGPSAPSVAAASVPCHPPLGAQPLFANIQTRLQLSLHGLRSQILLLLVPPHSWEPQLHATLWSQGPAQGSSEPRPDTDELLLRIGAPERPGLHQDHEGYELTERAVGDAALRREPQGQPHRTEVAQPGGGGAPENAGGDAAVDTAVDVEGGSPAGGAPLHLAAGAPFVGGDRELGLPAGAVELHGSSVAGGEAPAGGTSGGGPAGNGSLAAGGSLPYSDAAAAAEPAVAGERNVPTAAASGATALREQILMEWSARQPPLATGVEGERREGADDAAAPLPYVVAELQAAGMPVAVAEELEGLLTAAGGDALLQQLATVTAVTAAASVATVAAGAAESDGGGDGDRARLAERNAGAAVGTTPAAAPATTASLLESGLLITPTAQPSGGVAGAEVSAGGGGARSGLAPLRAEAAEAVVAARGVGQPAQLSVGSGGAGGAGYGFGATLSRRPEGEAAGVGHTARDTAAQLACEGGAGPAGEPAAEGTPPLGDVPAAGGECACGPTVGVGGGSSYSRSRAEFVAPLMAMAVVALVASGAAGMQARAAAAARRRAAAAAAALDAAYRERGDSEAGLRDAHHSQLAALRNQLHAEYDRRLDEQARAAAAEAAALRRQAEEARAGRASALRRAAAALARARTAGAVHVAEAVPELQRRQADLVTALAAAVAEWRRRGEVLEGALGRSRARVEALLDGVKVERAVVAERERRSAAAAEAAATAAAEAHARDMAAMRDRLEEALEAERRRHAATAEAAQSQRAADAAALASLRRRHARNASAWLAARSWLGLQVAQLVERAEALSARHQRMLEEARAALALQRGRVAGLQKQLAEQVLALEEAGRHNGELVELLGEKDVALVGLEAELDAARAALESQRRQCGDLSAALTSTEEALGAARTEALQLAAQLAEAEASARGAEARAQEMAAANAELDAQMREFNEMTQLLARMEEEYIGPARERAAALERQVAEQRQVAADAAAAAEARLTEAAAELAAAKREIESLKQSRSELEEALERRERELRVAQAELAARIAREEEGLESALQAEREREAAVAVLQQLGAAAAAAAAAGTGLAPAAPLSPLASPATSAPPPPQPGSPLGPLGPLIGSLVGPLAPVPLPADPKAVLAAASAAAASPGVSGGGGGGTPGSSPFSAGGGGGGVAGGIGVGSGLAAGVGGGGGVAGASSASGVRGAGPSSFAFTGTYRK